MSRQQLLRLCVLYVFLLHAIVGCSSTSDKSDRLSFEHSIAKLTYDRSTAKIGVCTAWREPEPSYEGISNAVAIGTGEEVPGIQPFLRFPGRRVTALSFALNGRAIACGLSDCTIHYWSVDNDKHPVHWLARNVDATCIASTGNKIYVGVQSPDRDPGQGGTVRGYTVDGETVFQSQTLDATPVKIAVSESSVFVIGDAYGKVCVIDSADNKMVASIDLNRRPILDLSLSSSGKLAVVGKWDGFAVVNTAELEMIAEHSQAKWRYHVCRVKEKSEGEESSSQEILTISSREDGRDPVAELWKLQDGSLSMLTRRPVPAYTQVVVPEKWDHIYIAKDRQLQRYSLDNLGSTKK